METDTTLFRLAVEPSDWVVGETRGERSSSGVRQVNERVLRGYTAIKYDHVDEFYSDRNEAGATRGRKHCKHVSSSARSAGRSVESKTPNAGPLIGPRISHHGRR